MAPGRLKRTKLAVCSAVLSGFALVSFASADPPAPSAGSSLYGDTAVPDISGIWLGTYSGGPNDRSQIPLEDRDITEWAPKPAPLKPPYKKMNDISIASAKVGRQIGEAGARCLPRGMPIDITIGLFPQEVIQTPGEVSLFIFGTSPALVIWTDGRTHPKDLTPSYAGHSVGYWDGDTLNVDTIGILARTPIDAGPRTPHSDKLHMKWTIQRVTPDVVHVHVTLYDEDAFTEPMVTTNIWRRKTGREWEVLDDGSCFENNRNAPDAHDVTGFQKF